jgi:hypothetical protein
MRTGKIVGLCALVVAGLGVATAPKAEAAYVAYLFQDGSNVVGTGSGSIDTTDLSFIESFSPPVQVNASAGYLGLGQSGGTDTVYGSISGPTTFGSGGAFNASSGSGSLLAIEGTTGVSGEEILAVPSSYVSGSSLGTSTDTWDSATLAALGISDGTYVWTWGSGANVDSFTLHVGVAPVPEPASTALLVTGLAGLVLTRRRRCKAV